MGKAGQLSCKHNSTVGGNYSSGQYVELPTLCPWECPLFAHLRRSAMSRMDVNRTSRFPAVAYGSAIPDEPRRELPNYDAGDDENVRWRPEHRADRAVNRLACRVACASRTVANGLRLR